MARLRYYPGIVVEEFASDHGLIELLSRYCRGGIWKWSWPDWGTVQVFSWRNLEVIMAWLRYYPGFCFEEFGSAHGLIEVPSRHFREGILKEVIMAWLRYYPGSFAEEFVSDHGLIEVPSYHFCGGTEGNHENLHSESSSVFWSTIEADAFGIQFTSAIAWANFFRMHVLNAQYGRQKFALRQCTYHAMNAYTEYVGNASNKFNFDTRRKQL
jgi:hypothetical protein